MRPKLNKKHQRGSYGEDGSWMRRKLQASSNSLPNNSIPNNSLPNNSLRNNFLSYNSQQTINILERVMKKKHCRTALNRAFEGEISRIHCLFNEILLIFELLNFAYVSWPFAYFLSYLLPASFQLRGCILF